MFAEKPASRIFYLSFVLIFSLSLAGLARAAPLAGFGPAAGTSAILQYTFGGHILGFATNQVFLAGLDHALTVEFVGTKGQMPAGQAAASSAEVDHTPALGQVTYRDMWPGVDVIYTAAQGGLVESTYVVQPGADPAWIQFQYNVPVELMQDGALRFAFESGQMTESAPVAFQEIDGRHLAVSVHFVLNDGQVGFAVGAYDPACTLTIDPIYAWHAFYGSTSTDRGRAITNDADGNLYVAGSSYKNWNGPGGIAPLRAYTGNDDIVVVKLNKAGAYQWHTFYGSADGDDAYAITSDPDGNIYIAGHSHAAWNGPGPAAPLHAHSGLYDIVVIKLNSAGIYQWHTFFGSTGNDFGHGLSNDGNGNVYVVGGSNAAWNGPGAAVPLHAYTGTFDIVVVKLNNAGAYQWHTFYGSTTWDGGGAITSSANGNIYVAGYSNTAWKGPGGAAPLNAHTGYVDIVVFALNSAGAYQWHTFYGSGGEDYGRAITSDTSQNVYVAGNSDNTWAGPGGVAPFHAYAGGTDIVVVKLNKAGAYQWHTFYGSSGYDYGAAMTSDIFGNLYLAGHSSASWNGPGPAAPLNAHAGNYDIVVVALKRTGTYLWHTFYGSTGWDDGMAISGNLHVVGSSPDAWNGPGGKAPLNAYVGSGDIVVIQHKFSDAFRSMDSLDGWVLESGENTDMGGTMDTAATSLRLGDDVVNKQFRSILSFCTNSLPDDAIITRITLKVRRYNITGGGDPVTKFQGFMVAVKKGIFGTTQALELADFQAGADKTYGPFTPTLTSGWYTINLTGARSYINKLYSNHGLTQIRLSFKLDDNNNNIANYLSLYSGNAPAASQPQLIVEYYAP